MGDNPQDILESMIAESVSGDVETIDEDVTNILQQRFGNDLPGADDEDEGDESEEEEDTDAEPFEAGERPKEASEPAPEIDTDLYRQYQEYFDYLEANPEVKAAVVAAVTNQIPTPPTPEPPPPANDLTPESLGLDLDEPRDASLWGLIMAQNQILGQYETRLGSVESSLTTRQQQEYGATVNRAVASYKTQHSLSDTEIGELREIASRLEVLPSLMKGVDPITGAPVPVDALTAVERALDIAYWNTPKFRDREFQTKVVERAKDTKRKQKAGSLSGSSGSNPRTPTPRVPKDNVDMRQMVAANLSQLMGETED